MIDHMNGHYRMLDSTTFVDALTEFREKATPTETLVVGTEDEIVELSRRVRLGATEIDKRRARRKQQAQSRRQNR